MDEGEYCVYCPTVVDDSVKFAWAYLLQYGKLTNGEWCYYGGCWEAQDKSFRYDYKGLEELRKKAVHIGIDWEKSGIPKVSNEGVFNGTFATHQGECLATLGELVLNNGETYKIGSDDNDAAHLAETARNIMKGKDDPVTLLAAKL
jgi:hypothetical protein